MGIEAHKIKVRRRRLETIVVVEDGVRAVLVNSMMS
jgi:hypothetical protein